MVPPEITGDNEPGHEEAKPMETMLYKETGLKDPSVTANTDVIDVEAIVLQVKSKYDKIVNGISSNSYDITVVDEGVTAYSEQDQIKAIVVKKDYGGYDYVRKFYYDGGSCFCIL